MRLDLPDFGETEDLKTSAVGQDRQGPIDKLMQAARRFDDLQSGADIQMVGVAEDNLSPHFQQFTRIERLDAALRPNGHKHGSIDDAMGGREAAKAGPGTCIGGQ